MRRFVMFFGLYSFASVADAADHTIHEIDQRPTTLAQETAPASEASEKQRPETPGQETAPTSDAPEKQRPEIPAQKTLPTYEDVRRRRPAAPAQKSAPAYEDLDKRREDAPKRDAAPTYDDAKKPQQTVPTQEAAPNPDDAENPKQAGNLETGNETIRVRVPQVLRDKAYRLRMERETVELKGEFVDFNDSAEFYSFQLIDRDGRVLDGEDGFIDANMLSNIRPNYFRIGIHLGEAFVRGDALRKILQDRSMSQQSLDFTWLPSAFGVAAALVGVRSAQEIDTKVTSVYSEAQGRIGLVYELVPFGHQNGYFSWFHLDLGAGALYSNSWISIGDGVVTIDDKSTSGGSYLEANVSFPVLDFWFDLRSFASLNTLNFTAMNLKIKMIRLGVLLGGSYAF